LSLILLAGVVGAIWLWLAHRGRKDAAEKELRQICLGNERQAERLIESEMTRAPGIARGGHSTSCRAIQTRQQVSSER
jgi:hypothetical protein